jgi:ATP-binding cassette, subfamily B, multidrug efflux pump
VTARFARPDARAASEPESAPLVPRSARVERAAVGFDARVLARITAMAFRHRARMTVAVAATVLAAASQIVIPRLIGQAVDGAQGLLAATGGEAAEAALLTTAWLLLVAAILRGLFTMTQNYQGEAVGHLLAHELRLAYYERLQRLSFGYHDRVHTGDLMSRGILDVEGTRLWVHTGILRMVLLAVLIVGGAGMLLATDAPLALVALAFVPLVGVGASVARLRLRALWYALQEELGVLTRVMEENLGGIRVVRAFAAQAFEMARFDAISNRALAIAHRRIGVFVTSTTSMTWLFFLSMGLVLWLGGARVLSGHITVGELATFLAFMTILQQPVRQIAWMVNSIARASTCGGRLFEVIDLEPEIRDRPGALPLEPTEGVVRFEGVSFAYHPQAEAPPVLEEVSFEVRPGTVLGIVGPPGSGKSTVAQLIPRYYDVTGGRITIDGIDIRDVTLESLRRQVSVVQQDPFLFTAAIETNVAYGDPWADRSAVRRATETAQLHNYVAQLPAGYGTLVGERGVSLSGGQRQRLAIARSLVPDSRVVVFDDSTAAVDAGTERQIREALREFTRERAVIVIAHRLSSLMHADQILFLEAGRVVERGTHAELIALGGRYAALHALQSHGAPDERP